MNRIGNNRAQSFLEYSMVIGLVVAILIAMTPFIRRTLQGMVRLTADQIGNQTDSDQIFNEQTRGYLQSSYSSTRSNLTKDAFLNNEVREYIYDDSIETDSNAMTDLGTIAGRAP